MSNLKLIGRPCESGIMEWLSEMVEFHHIKILKYDEHAANSLRAQFYSSLDEYCKTFDWWVGLTREKQTNNEHSDKLFDSKCKCSDIVFKMEETLIEIKRENEINVGYV